MPEPKPQPAAAAVAEPTIPEELWANLIPSSPFVPLVCYPGESHARVFGERAGLESRLVGVDPRYREAIDRIAELIQRHRESPYDSIKNLVVIDRIESIVNETKAKGAETR